MTHRNLSNELQRLLRFQRRYRFISGTRSSRYSEPTASPRELTGRLGGKGGGSTISVLPLQKSRRDTREILLKINPFFTQCLTYYSEKSPSSTSGKGGSTFIFQVCYRPVTEEWVDTWSTGLYTRGQVVQIFISDVLEKKSEMF